MGDAQDIPQISDEGERIVPDLHHDAVSYAEHVVRYLFAARLVGGMTVLDAASGVGYGSELMKAAGAKRVIALDYAEEAVRYGQLRHGSGRPDYVAGDAQRLPLQDGTMDAVVSFETIEHLARPYQFVQEVRRVLRPDGLFVVSTPNKGVFIEGNPYHVHEFTFEELDKLLRDSFMNVRTYVQDDWISSAVLTPENMETEDQALTSGLDTYKAMSRTASQALFVLSLCSDGELPDADEQAVMTGIYEMKGFVREVERRDEEIAELRKLWPALQEKEQHIANLQAMVLDKDRHLANVQAMIAERDGAIEQLTEALRGHEKELQRLYRSLGYRLFAVPRAALASLRGKRDRAD